MPWPDSDEALVELAKTDREAFGVLYERYVTRVYSYIYYRVGGRRQDAEDLTARTFLQALAHLPRYRQQGVPISAWLLRIAHNLVANWHRDRKKPLVPLDETVDVLAADDRPGDTVERREERRELLAAIAELPSERQQLLVLRFVEGMRAADIAVVMGRSEGAVKALLHRTIAGLRRSLTLRARTQENATAPFGGR
ncbi:MAG: sigma-70 family RNA polymerase sigma factor [Chloroflexota bacterium]